MSPAAGGGQGIRVTVAATLSMSLSVSPAFLTASLAVFIRPDMGFSEQQLGLALSVFFGIAALTSAAAGRLAERIGPRRAIITAGLLSSTSMVGIGVAARDWALLVAFLSVGALGNSLGQNSLNLAVAHGVPQEHHGVALGTKHAAAPTATMLGGLAVPLVGLTVGWRWAMAAGPVLLAAIIATLPSQLAGSRRVRPGGSPSIAGTPLRHLALLAVAAGLAGASANGMVAFLVESSVSQGVATGTAGLVMAAGSVGGILVRVLSGLAADRRRSHGMAPVVAMMWLGCAGYVLLASGARGPLLVAGALLGFAGGWGWPGLLVLGVVTRNPHAPAAATGITQTGVFAGAVAGPLVFAGTLSVTSYRGAWLAMAALCGLAALLARHADRQARSEERIQRSR